MARPGRRIVAFGLDVPPRAADWGVRNGALAQGDELLMALDELPVAGLHNAANALAALALGAAAGVPVRPMLDGIRRFKGLPHRLEKVEEIGGVTFYDDSKGTNVGATVAALNGMTAPVVLIAGGDGKGQDFSPLGPAIAARCRALVLIGRDAPQIEAVVSPLGMKALHARSMEEAIRAAFGVARPGDAVLLSPACASYDMFRSYVHRGECFVQAVHALAKDEEVRRGE
jgi:UDP-N-acetylmuramoylalanine--D-glutamate ligase